ncbi:hypothetical protein NE857_32835 [Nocardiopsis exhalans]|uniref:Uncharacterized protein n=1 Tax=Nocardiopsis exhalans TaxID=163604 RepID=A0ABY5D7H5_9ACTN|nr:hypothetical protein [Nocardiopsis exhalans]USY19957.1 hypothetical protein NE857_32835 [Nocardiopsis exhalans]
MFGFGLLLALLGAGLVIVWTQSPRTPETEETRYLLKSCAVAAFALAWFFVVLALLFGA